MSSVKWTENQKNAINARNGSVLVSAAAGSGKTAVLVQRVIDTITDKVNPISVDRMLIVTFTRAASKEMRVRIDDALNKLLEKDPYNNYLLRQKQLLYSAKISTIDGFCTELVRQYFYKLDIANDFKIANEKDLELIKNKALDNTIEHFYNENSDDFQKLVGCLCDYKNDYRLRDSILKIYRFLVTIPFPEKWLDNALDVYDIEKTPVATSRYIKNIIDYANESLNFIWSVFNSIYSAAEVDTSIPADKILKITDMIENDKLILQKATDAVTDKDWDELYRCVNISIPNFPVLRGFADDPMKVAVKAVRDSYIAEFKKLKDLFVCPISEIESQNILLFPAINSLFKCVKKFSEEFTNLKRDKNVLDFSDIENNMINLTCEYTENGIQYTDTAKELSGLFDCIMVDEFQDINEVQNLIFKAISKDESNLFMVGDVKQSIYGFRQAKPEIFIDYKNKYNLYSKSNENYPAKIILDKNFRSRAGVLDACNFVFKNIMSPDVGGIVYNDEEKLFCGASYPETNAPQMEVNIIDSGNLNIEEDETKVQLEAKHVAKKIYEMINIEGVTISDKGVQRKATYGDIAILFRSDKGHSKRGITFVNELVSRGIPAVSSEKNSFFQINEIKIMINLLRVIDNPLQDIPVMSVLMSPIYGFTADDITQVRLNKRHTSLYNAVLDSCDTMEKSARFISEIARFRKLSVTTTVDKLIGIILQVTNFNSVVMAVNNDNCDNLNLLQKYARDFGKESYKSLSAFIHFIDKLQERGVDLDAIGTNTESDVNAVQVMSAHSSKGLEFPICFICCANTKFNLEDVKKDVILDCDTGLGIRYKEDFIKYDTIQRKSVILQMKNSFISEEMRILYVAMTRAKERLIITMSHKEPKKFIESAANKITDNEITPYAVKNSNSFADWIVACGLLHPSCDKWRSYIEKSIIPQDDAGAEWSFNIYNNDDIADFEPTVTDKKDVSLERALPDYEFLNKFVERINYCHPLETLQTIPQKVSASAISHNNQVFDKVLKTPNFVKESTPKGTDIGTAFHCFMEHCDIKNARDSVTLEAQRLVDKGFLTEQQQNLLDVAKITEFLNTPLVDRIINAKEFYREYQFTVNINLSEYDENIDNSLKEQKIVMQGAVDLAFAEEDGLVIVDYKTDRVKDVSVLSALYSKQLLLYKNAMEQCTGLKVKEMYIYSVNLNKLLKI